MIAGSGTSGTGKIYYYYICPKCNKRCNAEKIEKVVLNEMSRLSNEPELLNDIVMDIIKRTVQRKQALKNG